MRIQEKWGKQGIKLRCGGRILLLAPADLRLANYILGTLLSSALRACLSAKITVLGSSHFHRVECKHSVARKIVKHYFVPMLNALKANFAVSIV